MVCLICGWDGEMSTMNSYCCGDCTERIDADESTYTVTCTGGTRGPSIAICGGDVNQAFEDLRRHQRANTYFRSMPA